MIPLLTIDKPVQLTDTFVAEKTALFIATAEKVWGQPWLKAALLTMSRSKCAFCECSLGETDSYMEVEHFHHKSKFQEKVLEWENLIPSCKRCNGSKSDHNVEEEPILNPRFHLPKANLKWKADRIIGTSPVGKSTVTVIYLNDIDRLVRPRFNLRCEVEEKLDELSSESETCNTEKNQKRVARTIGRLLLLAQPDKQFSATVATVLLNAESYAPLKQRLESWGRWSEELTRLESQAKEIALPLA